MKALNKTKLITRMLRTLMVLRRTSLPCRSRVMLEDLIEDL